MVWEVGTCMRLYSSVAVPVHCSAVSMAFSLASPVKRAASFKTVRWFGAVAKVLLRSGQAGQSLFFSRSLRSTSAARLATEKDLERAKEKLSQVKEDPGNEIKLKLYGLFKQVIESLY